MQWNCDLTEVNCLSAVEPGCTLKGSSSGCCWPLQVHVKMNCTQLHALTAANKWAVFDGEGSRLPLRPQQCCGTPRLLWGDSCTCDSIKCQRFTLGCIQRAQGALAISETATAQLITASAFVLLSGQYTCTKWVTVGRETDARTFTMLDSDFPGYPFAPISKKNITLPWHQKGKGKQTLI